MWWDAHSHLSFYSEQDLNRVFSEGALLGLTTWLQGGYDQRDWERQQQIYRQFPKQIRTAFGLHPWAVTALSPRQLELQWTRLTDLAPQAHLIGETGLDYFHSREPQQLVLQEDFFRRHLILAAELSKPLVLHIVQAHGPALTILRASGQAFSGLVHAFSGSPEVAAGYLRLGFLLSVGPGLLKKGSKQLKQTVATVDLKHLVIESDSPQNPEKPEVEVNWVPRVARAVGEIKGTAPEEVLAISRSNLERLGL